MSARLAAGWTAALVLALTATATAQSGGTGRSTDTAATEPEAETTPPPPALPPGISERTPPAWVAIQRGHRAFLTRDFDTALAAYREAAMATPPLPIAHYFVGAAQRAKGQLDEAIESFRTVSRLAGDTDPSLNAKALFNIAMTLEAKQNYPGAREAWLTYKTWCTTHASINGFPQVADERVAVIDAIAQLDQAYAAVRERIAERERVAAEQAANPPQ